MKKAFFSLLMLCFTGLGAGFSQSSLTVLNPQSNWYWRQGRIEKATLSVRPAGTNFEMGLYLDFSSAGSNFSGNIQLETVLSFSLPEGSQVIDSWLWVEDDIVQGKIIDIWTASRIYEGIVNRRRDPSILKKTGQDRYELRVYPMKPGEVRKVKITYLAPALWRDGKVSIPLPADILRASNQPLPLHLISWPEAGWEQPEISEWLDAPFAPYTDKEFGSYYRLDIPSARLSGSISYSMKAPLTNGVFLSIAEDSDESDVYQLAVDFSQFITNEESKKIAILVDYESSNTTINREDLFVGFQRYLLDHYTAKDSFNLFYSRYEIESFEDHWVPITESNLTKAFEPLRNGFLTLYSNLPGLLSKGNQFIDNKPGGQIVLFSNADNYGDLEKANKLIKDIQEMNLPPVNIADIQDKQYSSHYIANRWYYGQEYLFINLSRLTGGGFEKLTDHIGLNDMLSSVFGSLGGMISAFDLYSSATNGFCFARFNQNESEVFHPGDYFVQTGRYLGEAPFTLYLTGIFNSEPFNQLIQVEESKIYRGDSLISKGWHGAHIRQLEKESQDNEKVLQILSESIENRVLSVYSAFLSLEPSDTVAVCTTCKDESRLTGIWDVEQEGESAFELFPNPCVDFVNMKLDIPSDWNGTKLTIQVFSIGGQLVYEKESSARAGEKFEFNWNLAATSGNRVPSGTYMVQLSFGIEKIAKSLIVK